MTLVSSSPYLTRVEEIKKIFLRRFGVEKAREALVSLIRHETKEMRMLLVGLRFGPILTNHVGTPDYFISECLIRCKACLYLFQIGSFHSKTKAVASNSVIEND